LGADNTCEVVVFAVKNSRLTIRTHLSFQARKELVRDFAETGAYLVIVTISTATVLVLTSKAGANEMIKRPERREVNA
jgi:hypothetical protein